MVSATGLRYNPNKRAEMYHAVKDSQPGRANNANDRIVRVGEMVQFRKKDRTIVRGKLVQVTASMIYLLPPKATGVAKILLRDIEKIM